jgi:hypothetical protein
MIGEASGVTTLINNERIQRENQVNSESSLSQRGEDVREQNFSDVTSFSSEALALAKNVTPAEGTAEQDQIEQQNQDQEKIQNSTTRFLDIRV